MKKLLGMAIAFLGGILPGCKKELGTPAPEEQIVSATLPSLRTAASLIQWRSCFGTAADDFGQGIDNAPGGGYFICGTVNGVKTAYVAKVNSSSDWTVNISGNGTVNDAMAVVATPDGGCLIAGSTNSTEFPGYIGDGDVLLVKLSASGVVQWRRAFGTTRSDKANAIIRTTAGFFYLTGYSGDDLFVAKLENIGETPPAQLVSWQRSYALTGFKGNSGYSLVEYAGSLVIAGRTLTATGSSPRILFAKVSEADGASSELKALSGTAGELGFAIIRNAENNGFVIAGRNSVDGLVLTVDDNGNRGAGHWLRTFGGSGSDLFTSIEADANGYVLVGKTNSRNGDIVDSKGSTDLWIMQIGPDGTKKSSYNLGGSRDDEGNHVVRTPDHHYAIIGSTRSTNGDVSGNKGGLDIWALKVQLP